MAQDKRINDHLSQQALREQEEQSLCDGYGSRHLSPTFVYDFKLLPKVVVYHGPSRCCIRRMVRQAKLQGERSALVKELSQKAGVSHRTCQRWLAGKLSPSLYHWLILQYFMYFKGYVSEEISRLPDYVRSLVESVIQDKISLGKIVQHLGYKNSSRLYAMFLGHRKMTKEDKLGIIQLVRHLSDQQYHEAVLAVVEFELNEEGDNQLTDVGLDEAARFLPDLKRRRDSLQTEVFSQVESETIPNQDGDTKRKKKDTKRKIRRNRAAKRKEKGADKGS